jgi:translation initiation factor 2 subunit 1
MADMNYPEKGEYVLCTVKDVKPYGIFVEIDGYKGAEGMVHVSEVASKWVKNIKDYAKQGEKLVLKVLKIDQSKGHVDLSLKSVKSMQKKKVLDANKAENRAVKLIDILCEEVKTAKKKDIIAKIEAQYDSLFEGLQAAVDGGEEAFKGMGFKKDVLTKLVEICQKNIESPRVTIKATLKITSTDANAIEHIKSALVYAEKEGNKGEMETVIKYIGAPNYSIQIIGDDYKPLEKYLEKVSAEIEKRMKAVSGTFELIRDK